MIATVAGARATALALACACVCLGVSACSQTKVPQPPHNADERLADDVMDALLRDDMRPVVSKFVPEREADLLDPAHVKQMHDYIRGGGAFLGAREVDASKASNVRSFVASFAGGDVALQMSMDDRGKIVHYHLGGSLSKP